jgi:thiazole synthase ThiGH ThiG subunit
MPSANTFWTKMTTLRRLLMNTLDQSIEELFAVARKEEIDLLPNIPPFLSMKEAAFVLHVSLQTVERMIIKGSLKPNEDGDILKADLAEYLLSHTLADVPVLE